MCFYSPGGRRLRLHTSVVITLLAINRASSRLAKSKRLRWGESLSMSCGLRIARNRHEFARTLKARQVSAISPNSSGVSLLRKVTHEPKHLCVVTRGICIVRTLIKARWCQGTYDPSPKYYPRKLLVELLRIVISTRTFNMGFYQL